MLVYPVLVEIESSDSVTPPPVVEDTAIGTLAVAPPPSQSAIPWFNSESSPSPLFITVE